MKIAYFSYSYFADCDFPLVGEMQRNGLDVQYYIPIASYSKRATLFDLKEIYPKTGIFPVTSIYKEFDVYKDILDLSKMYVINQVHKQKYHPANIFVMLRFFLKIIVANPDIIHFTQQPSFILKLFYLVRHKLVLTVHDPFLHSGRNSMIDEFNRKIAFRLIPKLLLLNSKQIEPFSSFYKIPQDHIFLSRLGEYNSIAYVKSESPKIEGKYILYFGLIAEYKGVEILLKAMQIVHQSQPNVKLVIAGSGKFYFDIEPYNHLDYIIIKNYYVGISELSGLLRKCLFGVCPYKDATQSGVIQTAFTLNVPMIVTDVGALPEAVENGKSGLVVPPNNVEALADGIISLSTNNMLLNKMRTYIKNEWKTRMSWKPICKDYMECYNTLL